MNKWRELFIDGEYEAREKILSNLTIEQVKHTPSAQVHSIYEELWHATRWQTIMVDRDEALYERWEQGERYPMNPPETEEDWSALVAEFLQGLEKALAWGASPEKLRMEVDPGVTMADVLETLAVHNAFHMGKIVAIKEAMGA